MTKAEQAAFVEKFLSVVTEDLRENVQRVPKEWDGVELRQWIADRIKARWVYSHLMKGRRFKNYQNEVIVRNL